MQARSDSLFHFTKSLDFLKGILQNGFQPRYSLEDTSLFGQVDYIGYPMVCFCDIPMSRISDHTAFYGEYGIGMTKEWGRKNNLHPLLYAASNGALVRVASKIFSLTDYQSDDDSKVKSIRHELLHQYFELTPMIKPVSGKMIVGGEVVEKDFSQENEWRYVPDHINLLFKNNFDELKAEENAKMFDRSLRFLPSDVKYIFVKADHEIPAIFDFIQTQLGAFPMNDIKVLISRIVSLETLARDL